MLELANESDFVAVAIAIAAPLVVRVGVAVSKTVDVTDAVPLQLSQELASALTDNDDHSDDDIDGVPVTRIDDDNDGEVLTSIDSDDDCVSVVVDVALSDVVGVSESVTDGDAVAVALGDKPTMSSGTTTCTPLMKK